MYYYYGLKAALCTLVKRPNLLDICNLWLKNKCDDMMGDITDGNIWKEFVFYVTCKKTKYYVDDPPCLGSPVPICTLCYAVYKASALATL